MGEQTSGRSGRRIWLERMVYGVVIVGIGIWIAASRLSDVPYTIVVDGKPVVTAESLSAAKQVLDKVRLERASGVSAGAIRFVQRVTLRRAAKDAELAEVPEAIAAVEKVVAVEAEAFAITADNTPVAALTSKKDAEETLRLVKRHHERRIRNLYTESTFAENVFIDKRYVEIEKLCSSPEEAAHVLTSTSEKPIIHTIQPGDRAVNLAQQYGVALSELQRLNANADLNQLTEGDQLLIRPAKSPVTVISKALVSKTITVTPPPEVRRRAGGRVGKGHIRTLVTYQNGEPVSEEIISQIITWESPRKPVPRRTQQ